jgi:hypothetical protein
MEPAIITDRQIELRPGLDFLTLAYAYWRWRDEGLFPIIFHDHTNLSLNQYLDWVYQPTVEAAGCFVDGELIGIGWILQAKQVAGKVVAEVGAGFFRGTPLSQWHRSLDMMLEYAFVNRGVEMAYGLSPATNRAAHVLAGRCGIPNTGCLPMFGEYLGQAVDMVIYAIGRQDWESKRGAA